MRTQHPTRSCLPATAQSRKRRRATGALLFAAALVSGLGTFSVRVSAAQVGSFETGQLPGLGSGKIWSVAVEPSVPSTLLAGTDAGVYVSHDTGATWTVAMSGARVWTVGYDIRHPSNAFAGTDGKGVYASTDAGTTWLPANTGLPEPRRAQPRLRP